VGALDLDAERSRRRTSTSMKPSKQIGSSYWEVWKFFGMSG
jgi:hypothetical protein